LKKKILSEAIIFSKTNLSIYRQGKHKIYIETVIYFGKICRHMLRLISSNALWQAAVLPTKAMSHQGKFFYRRRHQVEPLMRMKNLTPVYPPPGYNLELPGNDRLVSCV